MTLFIQIWKGSKVPLCVQSVIENYSTQDVIFIPEGTLQNYDVIGNVESTMEINMFLEGLTYSISPGTILIGTDLQVNLK